MPTHRRSTAVVRRNPTPALVIFARTPVPRRVKTRLIPLLGPSGAAQFQAALISDTVRKVDRVGRPAARYFFFAGTNRPAPDLFRGHVVKRQEGRDLGERLARAFRHLLRRHSQVVVVGTDSPMLPPRLVRQALAELRICDAVLGPCPDGGYYLAGLRRLKAGIFGRIRWGTRSAFRDTLRNLLRAGVSCSILEPVGDVDRPEDLERLQRELLRSSAARRLAPSVWRFLKNFRRS